jgi:hypothetical protein
MTNEITKTYRYTVDDTRDAVDNLINSLTRAFEVTTQGEKECLFRIVDSTLQGFYFEVFSVPACELEWIEKYLCREIVRARRSVMSVHLKTQSSARTENTEALDRINGEVLGAVRQFMKASGIRAKWDARQLLNLIAQAVTLVNRNRDGDTSNRNKVSRLRNTMVKVLTMSKPSLWSDGLVPVYIEEAKQRNETWQETRAQFEFNRPPEWLILDGLMDYWHSVDRIGRDPVALS